MGLEVIAIDGPAGAGKSTVARELARRLGWRYVDSGAMYRAVALTALERGVDFSDSAALGRLSAELDIRCEHAADEGAPRICVDGTDVTGRLREPQVTANVGRVADSPEVRRILRALQRRWSEQGGLVMDGRDIGTHVFPAAKHKFYLDADVETRARRRLQNIRDAGYEASVESVAEEIRRRDKDDRRRAIAPLAPAADAVVVDTSRLAFEEVVARLMAHVRSAQRP